MLHPLLPLLPPQPQGRDSSAWVASSSVANCASRDRVLLLQHWVGGEKQHRKIWVRGTHRASRGAHVAIADDVAPDTTTIAGMLLRSLLLVFAFSGFNITHFLGSYYWVYLI